MTVTEPSVGVSFASPARAGWPLDAPDPPEWPWFVDPLFLIAVLIIGAAVWWVWSGRAPH